MMKSLRILSIVSVSLLVAAGQVAYSQATNSAPIADAQIVTWTDKRVAEWQPKASERRMDEIGWAKDIRTAEKLAQSSQRPVFIFTMDGRINIGRC
ncbi:MAG: hypothetical protein ABJA67_07480 [Chthonomonadales bacterium]